MRKFFGRNKRIITILSSILIFFAYFILTDPDARIITDLKYGKEAVFLLSVFAVSMMTIAFLEVHTDIYTDEIVSKQTATVNKAASEATGAGLLMLAKAVTILAYAIVVAAAILTVRDVM